MLYDKRLKVGKTERYTFGLSAWLDGDTLTTATVTACGGGFTVGTSGIEGGSTIGFTGTGVTAGRYDVIFNYSTSTRSDSAKHQIEVVAADACPV